MSFFATVNKMELHAATSSVKDTVRTNIEVVTHIIACFGPFKNFTYL
jgi:hypothetical protein